MDRAANQPTSENVPNVAESIKTGMSGDHYVGERAGASSKASGPLNLGGSTNSSCTARGMELRVRSLQSFENL